MHTPSIKPCQAGEGSPFMPRTRAHTHTGAQTRTGGELIYAAVYYHYHQTRGSEREPGCISPLDAHHHRLSLRCLSSCHFAGGPAGVPGAPSPSSSPLLHPLRPSDSFLSSLPLFCCICFPALWRVTSLSSFMSHFHAASSSSSSSPRTSYLIPSVSSSSHSVTVATASSSLCPNICLQISPLSRLTHADSKRGETVFNDLRNCFLNIFFWCPCGSITPRCIFITQVKHCGSNLRVALIKIQLLGHFGGHYFERQLPRVIITLMDN